MRTGKLSISRGHELDDPAGRGPRLTLVPKSSAPIEPVPARRRESVPATLTTEDYRLVHDRLTALERLARLHCDGILSDQEFAAEKLLVLNLPADELILRQPIPTPALPRVANRSSPSLVGRMFSWKFIPVGLVAGLALSFGAQPRETMRFVDEAVRLLGA